MHTVVRGGRFYFWPIIAANVLTMSLAVGGSPIRSLAFALVISSLASFGFLLNDLWDRDIDRVNTAGHFENSDVATLRLGVVAAGGFLTAGLTLAFFLGTTEVIVAVGIAIALAMYTVVFRRLLFIPTIVAAVLSASPLWAPLVVWRGGIDLWKSVFIAAIVLILAAREVLMDVRDRLGDQTGQRDTFATVFGGRTAKFVAVVLTVSSCLILVATVLPTALVMPPFGKLAGGVVGGTIIYLLVRPAVRALLEGEEERTAIQNYVHSSRAAMALIPLLNLLLWRA